MFREVTVPQTAYLKAGKISITLDDWPRQNIRDDCRTTAVDPGADADRFCGAIRMKESTLSLDVPHVPSSPIPPTPWKIFLKWQPSMRYLPQWPP